MARPVFDKQIQLVIGYLHDKNPLWKAPRIRKELLTKHWKPIPSSSYIRNKLKKIRDNEAKGSVLDKPWSLASLTMYPVPYEILPWLSWLAEYHRKQRSGKEESLFKIRDALWIGRLSVLSSEDKDPNRRTGETEAEWERRQKKYISTLLETSLYYYTYERACERAGLTPIDTSEFDASSVEKIFKNFNRHYFGDEESEVKPRRLDSRIEKAWIRFQKAHRLIVKGG